MHACRNLRRNAIWVPTLAFALSMLLIVGQTLNCCRFNESLSASVARLLDSLYQGGKPAYARDEVASPKAHGGCHGHSVLVQAQPASQPVPTEGPRLMADEACLSEIALHPEAVQPASTAELGLLVPVLARIPAPSLPRLAPVENPRPQNKGSPPVYLLTLRLLV